LIFHTLLSQSFKLYNIFVQYASIFDEHIYVLHTFMPYTVLTAGN